MSGGGERLKGKARAAHERGRALGRRSAARLDMPWARYPFVRLLREGFLSFLLGPAIDFYMRRKAMGRQHFRGLKGPVVLVANHSSHLDTPIILSALPLKWRLRTAVGAAADYFYRNRLIAAAFSFMFNTVPIQRRGAARGSTDHLDRLIRQRWNLLLFPEGTRSRDGSVGRLRSGAAVFAAEHHTSIVPIHVEGTHDAMPPGRIWPRRLRGLRLSPRYRVTVHFGTPVRPLPGENPSAVMERVRAFLESGPISAADPIVPPDIGALPAPPLAHAG